MSDNSVIAAVATGALASGIGVVRISGAETFSVVEKVFFPVDESKKISTAKGYTALYGKVKDEKGLIDDGIALVFRAPHSFTGENTVELSVHGGGYLLSRVMAALIAAGARQAGPGEFTRRAFLNGKLDLTAAEAVMSTVSAQGEMQLRAANARRSGATFKKISALRSSLADICAHAAAWCDFPEEDVEELTDDSLISQLRSAKADIEGLIKSADTGLAVTNGIRTAICGRPNVGKSTVMNLLSGDERSIVTSVAGTTRDVVEASVNVEGVTLLLADTAGIRETDDPVERIGVDRSRGRLRDAGLLLCVFDGSVPPEKDDIELIESMKDRPSLMIVNKSDLGVCDEWEKMISEAVTPVTVISAADEKSLPELTQAVMNVLSVTGADLDGGLLTNARELEAATRALDAVNGALDAVNGGFPPDVTAVCIEDAVISLGEITGESASETVIEKVFANFCVGK